MSRFSVCAGVFLAGWCPAAVVSYAQPADHEAVEAFFNSQDPFVQQTIIPNIEEYRKSDVMLRFVDGQGQALPSLKISGCLQRHQFLFGACPPEKKPDLDRMVAAWSDVFHYGVAQNACKWANVEKESGVRDFSRVDQMLDLCAKHDVVLEYHFLTGYHPKWLGALPESERAKRQQAFAREVVRRYKDKIPFFQVYNEDWLTHIARAAVYFDQTEFFAELTKEFPGVKFGVSDCWSLDDSAAFPDPELLKQRYPGISYLAAHSHKPRRLWASPQQMYRNFDKYLGSGVKLHLSEFGIDNGPIEGDCRQGAWNEQNKVEYFVEVWAVAFSHPAVETCNHWDMGPGIRSRTGNALLNDDYSPKPAYEALRSLIKRKFSTTLDGRSDTRGQYGFRGFHGRYEIAVANQAGGKASTLFAVDPQTTRCQFIVDDAAGPNLRIRPAPLRGKL